MKEISIDSRNYRKFYENITPKIYGHWCLHSYARFVPKYKSETDNYLKQKRNISITNLICIVLTVL